MSFQDHFSGHAGDYARYRPRYPRELFEFLRSVAPRRELVWDCATGNGQAAEGLAGVFDRVVATDASTPQLSHAARHPRIHYVAGLAERAPLASRSVDLATVAQALHWLRWEEYYDEVKRVCRPGALVAAWTYSRMEAEGGIDEVMLEFYSRKVGPFWPRERSYIDAGYQGIAFPFPRVDAPPFEMQERWDLARMFGYLRTWSAVRRYVQAHGSDPVSEMEDRFRAAWGEDAGPRLMRWKLHLLLGRAG